MYEAPDDAGIHIHGKYTHKHTYTHSCICTYREALNQHIITGMYEALSDEDASIRTFCPTFVDQATKEQVNESMNLDMSLDAHLYTHIYVYIYI